MTKRDLGKMGECSFATWCAQVGLTANASHEDNRGWDFLVEFPFVQPSCNIPADMIPTPIKCQIQVKSTDTSDRKKASIRAITLSNLRYLATALMPTFFIFIEFNNGLQPNKAFLVHIDENLIEKILKRIREIDNKENVNKLNKQTLTINYDETHALQSLDGISLKSAIEKYVDGDMSDYVDRKRDFLNSIGFKNGNVTVELKLNKKELSNLIEATLGINKKIEATGFKIAHSRFGLQGKYFIEEERGSFSLNKKPACLGKIIFKKDIFSPGIAFNAELYLPAKNLLPPNSITFRIKGDFFDIRAFNFTEASLELFFHEKINVITLKNAITLVKWINENTRLFVEAEGFYDFPTLEITSSKINTNISFFDDSLEVVESTIYLAKYFELEQELSTSLSELIQNKNQINALAKVLTGNLQQELIITCNDSNFDLAKNTICVVFPHAILGDYIAGIILGLTGKLEAIDKEKFKLLPNQDKSKKIIIKRSDICLRKNEINAEFDKFINEHYDSQNAQIFSTAHFI